MWGTDTTCSKDTDTENIKKARENSSKYIYLKVLESDILADDVTPGKENIWKLVFVPF